MKAPPPTGCGGPWAAFSSGAVETYPTLQYQKIKGDKTCEGPPTGCGGTWAAFSSGAVEAYPTLPYPTLPYPTLSYHTLPYPRIPNNKR